MIAAVSKSSAVTGFPEWLPSQRMIEARAIDDLRGRFELGGFVPVETRSVEPVDVLLTKGETDKEIYAVRRLQAGESGEPSRLGLHFDLTIPLSRYIGENLSNLVFPFRRYQIQKVWRGERPGLGRFREFIQADIDVVDSTTIDVWTDIEVLDIASQALQAMPVPATVIFVNNRKLIEGFYRGLGIPEIAEVMRVLDKIAKIGVVEIGRILADDLGLPASTIGKCLDFAGISTTNATELEERVRELGVRNEMLEKGLAELVAVLEFFDGDKSETVSADLSIIRGFDYYTGSIFEARFIDFPEYPTIAAGGRYDGLVQGRGKVSYPGVGFSFGITRIFSFLFQKGLLEPSRHSPTDLLITLYQDQDKPNAIRLARQFRERGIACEVYPRATKLGNQIRRATRLGIPYVWFSKSPETAVESVKDLRTGEQVPADVESWLPDVR